MGHESTLVIHGKQREQKEDCVAEQEDGGGIDFQPILEGALYGPLRDEGLFDQVEIDPEVHTLVWPNGADFDPETLHDWPKYAEGMEQMAKRWAKVKTKVA